MWPSNVVGCLFVQEAKARQHLLSRQSEHPHLWGMSSGDFEVRSLSPLPLPPSPSPLQQLMHQLDHMFGTVYATVNVCCTSAAHAEQGFIPDLQHTTRRARSGLPFQQYGFVKHLAHHTLLECCKSLAGIELIQPVGAYVTQSCMEVVGC